MRSEARFAPDARRAEIRPRQASPIISQELGQDFRSIGLEPFPRILAMRIKDAIKGWPRDHLAARPQASHDRSPVTSRSLLIGTKIPRSRPTQAVRLNHCRTAGRNQSTQGKSPNAADRRTLIPVSFLPARPACDGLPALAGFMCLSWRLAAPAADDGQRPGRVEGGDTASTDGRQDCRRGRNPTRRTSSSSRRKSGPSFRRGATDATAPTSRRAVCGSMRGQPCSPAARPDRPLFPATPGKASWSTPSTMARPTRCPPSRSCLRKKSPP